VNVLQPTTLPPPEAARVDRIVDRFHRHVGHRPAVVVRAPGRVNLLGEHTDYNGLPVLPMAIDRSVLIAAAPRADRTVQMENVDARFATRQFTLANGIAPNPPGDWGNYVKAAAQGLMPDYGTRLRGGIDAVIDGNVPAGAGLSSSSAVVVASALALLAANDVAPDFHALAELLPGAERYVGTLSGGMDQATSLLAQAGHALRIDFFPLRVRPVPLPPGYSIVVCHSLIAAEKSGAAKQAYNQRVVECSLARRLLEHVLTAAGPVHLHTLGDLVTAFPQRSLLDFVPLLATRVTAQALAVADIATILGADPGQVRTECGAASEPFAVLRRARHVLSEAVRVDAAERALHSGDAGAFGALMNASHASCRDDYDISCPALEELVAVAREAGAVGARLTGAGFGGCTVNLVATHAVEGVLAAIDRRFYLPRLSAATAPAAHRFVFAPEAGATVLQV
jgi:galactokinase